MKINIKTLINDVYVIDNIEKTDTIYKCKQQLIKHNEDLILNDLRFIYRGKILDNNNTLE